MQTTNTLTSKKRKIIMSKTQTFALFNDNYTKINEFSSFKQVNYSLLIHRFEMR